MKINPRKTKVQPVNFSQKYNFLPSIYIGHQPLEVVYQTKLLGVTISSDCKWGPHVTQLVQNANKKMWFLRRLKTLGANLETLLDIYKLFVRQGVEIAAPVWAGALTGGNRTQLEHVQMQATAVICGQAPLNYTQRLDKLSLLDLDSRRLQITKKFAIKFSADPRFSSLFPLAIGPITRNNKKYVEPLCKTRRYQTSPLVTFIKILNQEGQKRGAGK